jgi:hypothetical protein
MQSDGLFPILFVVAAFALVLAVVLAATGDLHKPDLKDKIHSAQTRPGR